MTMLPAAAPSWCPTCGQPWEAHWRCPPPRKRRTGKLIALGVLVGVVLLIESVALAVWLDEAFMTPDLMPVTRIIAVGGPVIPMVRACELVNRWERTHHEALLDQAVRDASFPAVDRKYKMRLRTELSSLDNLGRSLDRVPQLGHGVDGVPITAHSRTAARHEHAISEMCAPVLASYRRALRQRA